MTRTTIVLGPLTRTGRALVDRAVRRGDDVFVVARHDADAAALAHDGATVLSVGQDVALLATGRGPVQIAVCALGPVHPGEPRAADDSATFLRDLLCIERLLEAVAGRQVGVVLISSVVALAPGEDRRYYGGWKCLVEQQLRQSVGRCAPGATFSVVYPGRLVDGDARRATPTLHTSHRRLATVVDGLTGRSRARLVGLDARAWVVVHALSLLASSLLPRRTSSPGRPLPLSLHSHERSGRS